MNGNPSSPVANRSMHEYEVRPRKDNGGVDFNQ
jgi:hypothetical protein